MNKLLAIDFKDRRFHIEVALLFGLAVSLAAFLWLRGETMAAVEDRIVAESRLDKASADLAHRIQNPLPWRKAKNSPWRLRGLSQVSAVLREFKLAEKKTGVHLEDVDEESVSASGHERFEIIGTGRVQSVCSFMAELEAQAFLLVPDSIHLLGVVGDDIRFVLTVSSYSSGVND